MVVGWEVKLKKLRAYPNLFIYYYALYHNIDHLPSIETPLKIWAYYLRSIWRFFIKKSNPLYCFPLMDLPCHQWLKTWKDRYFASSVRKNAYSLGTWKVHLMGKIMCILDGTNWGVTPCPRCWFQQTLRSVVVGLGQWFGPWKAQDCPLINFHFGARICSQK